MRARLATVWGRASDSVVLRVLWYLALILLAVIAYEGEVPFVYAQF